MTFKHTNEEVLKIKDNEKLKAIEHHLKGFRSAFLDFDFMYNILSDELNKYLVHKEEYINKNIEYYKKVKARYEELLKDESILYNGEKERIKISMPFIEENIKRETWEQHAEIEEKTIDHIYKKVINEDYLKNDIYKTFVYYITSDKETIENKRLELAKGNMPLFNTFTICNERIIRNYLDLQGIEELDEKVNGYELAINGMLNNDKRIASLNTSMITGAILDIRHNLNELIETFFDLEEEKGKEKHEQITLPLEYSQKATITDTGLINKLALTKLEDNYILQELKNLDFNIEESTIQHGEETLNKLDELDRFVLDCIVLDLYYKQGRKQFTNRQIAIQYCKEKGIEHITENILSEIDKSIIKLQNTRISLDYKSVQKLKKAKIKVDRGNPLIWINELFNVKIETNVRGYEIIETPFYFTYLRETNAPMITYDRKLLYSDIKGIEKNIDNQNLRHYLIRRLAPSKTLNTNEIYINISDIYEAQNIHKKDFKTDNALKIARKKARDRAELILKEYKKEYNFNYSKDDENKRIKGYIIRFKNKS